MKIQKSLLANGLTVITDRMDTVETVSLGVWVNVGTRDEYPDVNGVSHLLEHMIFKGTKRRDAYKIATDIEDVGGHINAYTSREHTAYYAKVLKDDLSLAVDLISDILQHSKLDEDELIREQAVILQEIHQANDTPDDIIFDYFQETAFPNQAMGRPVLGRPEIIQAIDRECIKTYMHRHYCGKRMIVAAAGNLEHETFVKLVEKFFDSLPDAKPKTRQSATYIGGDFRENRDLEQIHVVLGTEGISFDDEGFYAASVLSTILGGGMSSRLFQEIREKRGLAYSIYSFLSCFDDCGVFGVYAGTGPTEARGLLSLIFDELEKIHDGITNEELQRARAQLKSSILMSLESSSSRCERLARHLLVFGRNLSTNEIVEKINQVDHQALSKMAQRLYSGVPTVAGLGPIAELCSHDTLSSRLAK